MFPNNFLPVDKVFCLLLNWDI